jgi:outer membrane biosynthesis protein TonB
VLGEHDRCGYFESMARAGRTEPDSVSIWLKLSAEDAARMTQVLTRPEFAGWTRAEWCLEMIQTALGYYTRPRPPPGADGERAPAAEPAPAEPAPAEESATVTTEVVEEPEPAEPEPAEPEPARSVAPEPVPDAPEAVPDAPEPVPDAQEAVADEPEPPVQADCPHPADARDYQSGTCAACGAILWD